MDLNRLPGQDAVLTDAEYDRLDAILDGSAGAAMNLEELDGFFAALSCGPVTVAPSEYLAEIWGGEEPPFATVSDLHEFVNLAMRHWNSIASSLLSPDLIFIPLLNVDEGEELPKGNRWAEGFLRAVELHRADWEPIFEDDDRFAMLLPMMALAHEHDPDAEMRTWKTSPNAELREKVLMGLSVATQKLHDFFLARRKVRPVARAAKQKVGRNDSCPCGSGKKYKRCCGSINVTVN